MGTRSTPPHDFAVGRLRQHDGVARELAASLVEVNLDVEFLVSVDADGRAWLVIIQNIVRERVHGALAAAVAVAVDAVDGPQDVWEVDRSLVPLTRGKTRLVPKLALDIFFTTLIHQNNHRIAIKKHKVNQFIISSGLTESPPL